MNETYAPPEDELRGEIYRRMLILMTENRGSWQSAAAAAGLCGGLLSIALGALDWAAVGLFAPAGALGSFLDWAGTVLFALPLPLMALGAYCLDLLEKKPPALPRPAAPQPNARTIFDVPTANSAVAGRAALPPFHVPRKVVDSPAGRAYIAGPTTRP